MNQDTLNIVLVVIGAVLVGLVWALDRSNKRLSDSVPPNIMGILQVAVSALQTIAEKSPTTLDDEVVGLLKLLLLSNPPAPPVQPAGTVTTTGTAGSTVTVVTPPNASHSDGPVMG